MGQGTPPSHWALFLGSPQVLPVSPALLPSPLAGGQLGLPQPGPQTSGGPPHPGLGALGQLVAGTWGPALGPPDPFHVLAPAGTSPSGVAGSGSEVLGGSVPQCRPLCSPGAKPSRPRPSQRSPPARETRVPGPAPSSPAVPSLRPGSPASARVPRGAAPWAQPPGLSPPPRPHAGPSSPAFPTPEVTTLPRRSSPSPAVTPDAAVPEEIKPSAPGHPRHHRKRPGRSTWGLDWLSEITGERRATPCRCRLRHCGVGGA